MEEGGGETGKGREREKENGKGVTRGKRRRGNERGGEKGSIEKIRGREGEIAGKDGERKEWFELKWSWHIVCILGH